MLSENIDCQSMLSCICLRPCANLHSLWLIGLVIIKINWLYLCSLIWAFLIHLPPELAMPISHFSALVNLALRFLDFVQSRFWRFLPSSRNLFAHRLLSALSRRPNTLKSYCKFQTSWLSQHFIIKARFSKQIVLSVVLWNLSQIVYSSSVLCSAS